MRITPAMGPENYKTYQIAAPVSTHWQPATCEEVDCPNYLNGWQVRLEGLTPQQIHDATHCGRKYTQVSVMAGETWLVYEAGQPCFACSSHRKRIERDERFLVTGGDYRGNPRNERYEHAEPADWQEDMADHLDRLRTAQERG